MRAIERRGYHRLNDQLILEVTPVTRQQLQSVSVEDLLDLATTVRVARELYLLDLEARQLQADVYEKDPRLAAYFSTVPIRPYGREMRDGLTRRFNGNRKS